MHESSLVRGLVRQIEEIARQHGRRKVTCVRLKLGPLAHVDADHLRHHFCEAARGTCAESAQLEIETTEAWHELSLESLDLAEEQTP